MENISGESTQRKRFRANWSSGERIAAIAVCLLLAAGTFGAGLKYLEESSREQKLNAKNSSSKEPTSLLNSVNPFIEPPLPTSTPQLAKEYIYAGSRMLAVEDANASAAPPADLAVWRESTSYWYVMGGQGSQQTSYQWGQGGDKPVPGGYDGDGKTDFSVFRPSTNYWYVSESSTGYTMELFFGSSGDKHAEADYDGDGKTDRAVFRASTGFWYIARNSDSATGGEQFGLSTDIPAAADYDGDGKADIAVWRESNKTFYVHRSSDNSVQSQILSAASGDKPVSADYDGDGRADFAVRVGNNWLIRYSGTSYAAADLATTVTWYAGDYEVPNDYDGDGKVDEQRRHLVNQTEFAHRQSNELRQVQWGQIGDYPVPAFYRR